MQLERRLQTRDLTPAAGTTAPVSGGRRRPAEDTVGSAARRPAAADASGGAGPGGAQDRLEAGGVEHARAVGDEPGDRGSLRRDAGQVALADADLGEGAGDADGR